MNWHLENLRRDTPVMIRRLRSAVNYVLGTSLIGLPFISEKIGLSGDEFSQILGVAIVLCNVSLTMFGEDYEKINFMQQRAIEFQADFCSITADEWDDYTQAQWGLWLSQWYNYVVGIPNTLRPPRRPPL